MPSPFPGMDPYLEGSLWTTVHALLSGEIVRLLSPLLRPRYLALPNERFVLTVTEVLPGAGVTTYSTYPDAAVAEGGQSAAPAGRASAGLAAPPLRLETIIPEAVPQITIEIRDVAERRLVTAIEVLSPTNKRGDGREEYLQKRRRLLLSSAHLMEIDLLRTGQRVPMRQPLPPAPYFVFLSRAGSRPVTDVWPIALDQLLPTVPVPLLPGDGDVMLDLQRALTQVYDTVGYDLAVDYTRPPEVPFTPEQAAWAEQRLRAVRKA